MRATATLLMLLGLLLTACDDGGSVTADGAWQPDAGSAPDSSGDLGPLANVYRVNPVEDNKQTIQVKLQHLTDPEGKLSGKYADVWNCRNEPGGDTYNVPLGGMPLTGDVCHLVQDTVPGDDGTYLQITPPASDADGNDEFAAVMMYHHVTTIHDHYWNTFGLKHLENKRMRSLVNVQVKFLGQWVGILNAAYFPKETGSYLKQFGVDLNKGEDAIIFSQDTITSDVDPSYDASVIYHEYTHAAIGASALMLPASDQYGLDPTPKGLNEALADYFSASFLNTSTVGTYALAAVGGERDLARVFKCPDHIVGEEHTDGEVASTALWAVRKILGADVADKAIWNALLTFGIDTGFEEAAAAIVDEVKLLAPDKEAQVKQLFADRGMAGCVRLKDYVTGNADKPAYPAAMPGTYPDGTPAFIQYRLAVADTTKEITIEYTPKGESFMGIPIGGGTGDVWVALRPGSDPITWDYSSGKGVSDAVAVLQGADTGGTYKLVLSGDCVAQGDLVFQFLNKSPSAGSLSPIKVSQSATVSNSTDNFTGCTP